MKLKPEMIPRVSELDVGLERFHCTTVCFFLQEAYDEREVVIDKQDNTIGFSVKVSTQ